MPILWPGPVGRFMRSGLKPLSSTKTPYEEESPLHPLDLWTIGNFGHSLADFAHSGRKGYIGQTAQDAAKGFSIVLDG